MRIIQIDCAIDKEGRFYNLLHLDRREKIYSVVRGITEEGLLAQTFQCFFQAAYASEGQDPQIRNLTNWDHSPHVAAVQKRLTQ